MKQRFFETIIRVFGAVLIIPFMALTPISYILFNRSLYFFAGHMLFNGSLPGDNNW